MRGRERRGGAVVVDEIEGACSFHKGEAGKARELPTVLWVERAECSCGS